MIDFAQYMDQERARIYGERDALLERKIEIETQLTQLDRDMQAIDAYAAAKAGKIPAAHRPHQNQRRPGSRRSAIVDALRQVPLEGLARGELLETIGVKGDKSGEMAVSNALTALIKNGTLARNEGRKYVLA